VTDQHAGEEKSGQLDAKYWSDIKDQGPLAGITLDAGITPEDFQTYGDRLAQRQIEIYRRFASPDLAHGTVVDVGCGMGRISRPFAAVFGKVVGVDINADILVQARQYCGGVENVEFVQGDGLTIPLEDASVDFAYSGGVLQHIPERDVIMNYFLEGMRVLRPGGILNYSFQTWYTSREGGVDGNRVGAQLLASDFESLMAGRPWRLLGAVADPDDPIPHLNVVIEKATDPPRRGQKLRKRKVVDMPVRTGIFEDLASYEDFRKRWASNTPKTRRRVTFWD